MNESRFSDFSGQEVYMLSRALIESSAEIQFSERDRYSADEKKVHNDLLNEILRERRRRDYGW